MNVRSAGNSNPISCREDESTVAGRRVQLIGVERQREQQHNGEEENARRTDLEEREGNVAAKVGPTRLQQ